MNTVLNIPVSLNRQEIKSQCAVKPGTRAEAELERILASVEALARPKAIYRESLIEAFGNDTVSVEGTVFHSRALRHNLEAVGRIFPFIVTCGTEVDNTPLDPGDDVQAYWLSMIRLSLVRQGMDVLRSAVQDRYRIETLSVMNPGSGDADVWPLEEQHPLFALFGGSEVVEAAIGVRLLPSFFMFPDMSASGILFPGEITYVNCQLCQREDCPSRKAPFDAVLWASVNSPVGS